MNRELNDLAEVLEEQIAVGNRLRLNLAAQRQALVAWDMEGLIAGIEAREIWIRSLNQLEVRRARIVETQGRSGGPVTLNQLIMACPEGLPERRRLQSARSRARETFSRLKADQRDLNGLMESLKSHLDEALKALAGPSVDLYSETGVAPSQGAPSALIRSRA
jgi:hypothetical protein